MYILIYIVWTSDIGKPLVEINLPDLVSQMRIGEFLEDVRRRDPFLDK